MISRDLNFAILMEERFRKHSARLMQGATIRHRQKEMLKETSGGDKDKKKEKDMNGLNGAESDGSLSDGKKIESKN